MARTGGFLRGLPEWRWVYPTQPGEKRYAENVLTGETLSVRQAQNLQQEAGVTKRLPPGVPGPKPPTSPRGPVTYTKGPTETIRHGYVVGYYFRSLEDMQIWFADAWARQDPAVTSYSGWLIEARFSAKYKQAETKTAKRKETEYTDKKGKKHIRYGQGYASLSSTYNASERMAIPLTPLQIQSGILSPWEDAMNRVEWYKIDRYILFGVQK